MEHHIAVLRRFGTEEDAADDAVLLGFSQLGRESAWRMGNSRDIQEAARREQTP